MPEEQIPELPEDGAAAAALYDPVRIYRDNLARQILDPVPPEADVDNWTRADPPQPTQAQIDNLARIIDPTIPPVEDVVHIPTPAEVDALMEQMNQELVAAPPPPTGAGKPYDSEFRKGVEEMSFAEAINSRKPGLRERKCVMMADLQEGRKFIKGIDNISQLGYAQSIHWVTSIDLAEVVPLRVFIDNRTVFDYARTVVFLDEELLAREPAVRNFDFERVINKNLVALAKVSPTNKVLHGHLMAIFRQLPPDTITTYDKLREWIEYTFPEPSSNTLSDTMRRQYLAAYATQNRPTPIVHQRPEEAFRITVEARGEERGRARYSCQFTAQASVGILASNLTTWVRDGYTAAQMLEMVRNTGINGWSSDHDRETERETYDYYDEEASSSGASTIDMNNDEITEQIQNFIRSHYGPEEAERFLSRQ